MPDRDLGYEVARTCEIAVKTTHLHSNLHIFTEGRARIEKVGLQQGVRSCAYCWVFIELEGLP